MNKTVVVELDQNGKEIFHTAGYEKYWISRVGMEAVWLRKERVKEVVSVQETFAAMEFLEKPERGIVSAEISIRMKMTDESCRWTRVQRQDSSVIFIRIDISADTIPLSGFSKNSMAAKVS